jgi:DNA mismatch repair protein MutL
MGKIRQLDDALSNKIAAGEVVERPASVVKELVENSIDANSNRIEINIEEAGLSSIRIIDNGDGIEEEDCLTAFHRHATSKIKDEKDLFRIRTLGFRGEALPSIASVAEVELKTSTGEGAGTHLVIQGGKMNVHERTNSRKGTDITVKNLFFNTPARLKYLKTVHTELGNITDVVNRMALSHPEISFRLIHNGRKLLYTNGNGDLQQVIAGIYGMSIAKKMLPIQLNSIDFEVSGYIAKPEVTRASRNYISTMINGRYIKNFPLAKAIQQGFHTLLPIGRYPIVVLNITMDPLLVDVNVHPSKLEVRLSKEKELNELVEQGIRDSFKRVQLIPDVNLKKEKQKVEQQSIVFEHRHHESHRTKHGESLGSSIYDNGYAEKEQEEWVNDLGKKELYHQKYPNNENDFYVETEEKAISTNSQNEEETIDLNEPINKLKTIEDMVVKEEVDEQERVPTMYPIGQMHGTYIVAQNEKGLYIIDQHAAQERIKYEYFREKVGEVTSEVQELLIPLTLEYSQDEALVINAYKEELKKVGVFIEEFGAQAFIVRSHPQWFPKGIEQEIIEEMIEQLLQMKTVNIKKLREEAAIMMSCKASIKANHHLRDDEIFNLLETLRKSSDPFTCPHGRPIIVQFSTYEMEKMFKRVM